jgi:hypothetical protein
MGREYKKGGFKRERAESPLLFISTAAAAADVAMESKKKEKKRSDWNRPFSSSVLLARLFIARPSSININGVCPL